MHKDFQKCMNRPVMHPDRVSVRAIDFEEKEIYHPKKRPGYSAWVALWPGADGEWLLSFVEKRRLPNHDYRPIPLEFWEAMSLPIKYQTSFAGGSPDVLSEIVVMRTADGAKTWKEIGRSSTNLYCFFAYLSLSNGDILRAYHNTYVCYYEEDVPRCGIQRSRDMGNTWTEHGTIMSGYYCHNYRLKRLRDGTLVACGGYMTAFGPGRTRQQRHSSRPHVRSEHGESEFIPAVFVSKDQGRNWSGPLGLFPGCQASEPDFVELASGDLLFLNSAVQHGPQVRQYFQRCGDGFIPGPVFDVASGIVPEATVRTRGGLLVGPVRYGVYSCSNDEGVTWHTIEGLPNCGYEPMIACLEDGRFLCVWHYGGDSTFGEYDEYIGQHVFRLEVSLPKPSILELKRDMDADNAQYINAYSARLTVNGQSVAGKKVRFSYGTRYTPAYDEDEDPRARGESAVATTDENGVARAAFPEWDKEIDIHISYRIVAEFVPEEGDSVAGCESAIYHAYRVTAKRGCANPYAFYLTNGKLFVLGDVLAKHPALPGFIKNLAGRKKFTRSEAVKATCLSDEAIDSLLTCLIEHHVLIKCEEERYSWARPVQHIQEIEIEDDFV